MLILYLASVSKIYELEPDIGISIESTISLVIWSCFKTGLVNHNTLSHELQKLCIATNVLYHSKKVMSVKW